MKTTMASRSLRREGGRKGAMIGAWQFNAYATFRTQTDDSHSQGKIIGSLYVGSLPHSCHINLHSSYVTQYVRQQCLLR